MVNVMKRNHSKMSCFYKNENDFYESKNTMKNYFTKLS